MILDKTYSNEIFNDVQTIHALKLRIQQMTRDNLVLVQEVYRLRYLIQDYQCKLSSFQTIEQQYKNQLEAINKNSQNIIQRIDKSDTQCSVQISGQFNQLKKQIVYKKMQSLQSKYERKTRQCQELLGFKEKLSRIRNSWQLKNKDNSLDSLFVWIYNQIVKAKSFKQGNKVKKVQASKKQIQKSKHQSNKNLLQQTEKSFNKNQTSETTGFVTIS